ncbi:hypothetical protein A7P54_06965 [Acinetobacter sp. Ac_3412]|nr:hypothetical protein [Acinetobacter sp. Ac_3412]
MMYRRNKGTSVRQGIALTLMLKKLVHEFYFNLDGILVELMFQNVQIKPTLMIYCVKVVESSSKS